MSRKIPVVALLLGALALACNEGTGPSFDSDAPQAAVVPDGALNHLKWATSDSPRQFTAVGAARDSEILMAATSSLDGSSSGPRLDTYKVSFWAVKGEDREVQINCVLDSPIQLSTLYAQYNKTVTSPYLRFTVPAGALDEGPNSYEYETGDSVLITITVDPVDMVAHYEPSGLQFDEDSPAMLQVWYTGADDDFNGDGYVNETDAYIEANLLGIWTQQNIYHPWYKLSAEQSLAERWFKASIEHFSGYAVSWQE